MINKICIITIGIVGALLNYYNSVSNAYKHKRKKQTHTHTHTHVHLRGTKNAFDRSPWQPDKGLPAKSHV